MNLLNHLEALLKQIIHPCETLVCACSGGVDSMILLDLLVKLQKKLCFTVVVAHLNHGLRGKASDRDEKTVQTFAKKLDIACETKKENAAVWAKMQKISLEEAGRTLRNEFLKTVQKKYNATYVVKAHHADDQVETVLFNIVRGACLRGLTGMKIISGNTLRPLLSCTKQELRTYAKKHRIPFHEDISNKNISFSRNRIRKKIIPELRKVHPAFPKSLLRTIANAKEIESWMTKEAENFLQKHFQNERPFIDLQKFKKLPRPLQKQIIYALYEKFYKGTQGLTETLLQEIMHLAEKDRNGSQRGFGKNYEIIKKKNFLILKKHLKRVH